MLTRIESNEEIKERARKAMELNGFKDVAYNSNPVFKLKAASSRKYRPIVRIKQLNFRKSPSNIKLQGASFNREFWRKQKEKADKAMYLNYGF